MLCKNKLRVFVAFVVASVLAVALLTLAGYSYIKKLRADNKELYAALVEQQAVIKARAAACKILLSDPIVRRITRAR